MADKMVVEDKKEPAASLVPPVTDVEKKNKKQAPPLPAVQLVSLWALINVAIMLGSFFFAVIIPGQPSWFPAGADLTDAGAAELCAISHSQWVPWCTAAAAATAVLALLLPARHRRSRWAIACVALAATATLHLMLARVTTLVFATDLGNIFWWILVAVDASFLAAGDIICLLALLGRGAYTKVPADA